MYRAHRERKLDKSVQFHGDLASTEHVAASQSKVPWELPLDYARIDVQQQSTQQSLEESKRGDKLGRLRRRFDFASSRENDAPQ